jgi:hypothetical protein
MERIPGIAFKLWMKILSLCSESTSGEEAFLPQRDLTPTFMKKHATLRLKSKLCQQF